MKSRYEYLYQKQVVYDLICMKRLIDGFFRIYKKIILDNSGFTHLECIHVNGNARHYLQCALNIGESVYRAH